MKMVKQAQAAPQARLLARSYRNLGTPSGLPEHARMFKDFPLEGVCCLTTALARQ